MPSAPATIQVEKVMEAAIRYEASDIHLRVGVAPTLVVNGQLMPLKTNVLDDTALESLVTQLTATNQRLQTDIWEKKGVDFAIPYEFKGATVRFRVSAFTEQGRKAATLRRLPSKIVKASEIGFPNKVLDLVTAPRGLFLVTGPTGSGKTTTLASIIDYIAEVKPQHILTVE
jgi:twitching motility protein PilT